MNLPTILVILVLVIAVVLAVRSIVKDKKKGGCSGYSGGCSCSGHSHGGGCCH